MTKVELQGLDGRNLLAFLAALGTHAALSWKAMGTRLSWDADTFRASVHLPFEIAESSGKTTEEQLVELLDYGLKELQCGGERFPWNDIKVTRSELREKALVPAAELARATSANRAWADFVAGLASDGAGSEDEVARTALCAITGDSHQHFLGFMRDLSGLATSEHMATTDHLRATLFEPWWYRERGRSFRWDPSEDRRYSLRASDPSKGSDKEIPTMRGANRLAFEALSCLPCHPRGRRLRTTGFHEEKIFHWPLWEPPITVETLRGLLWHPAVVKEEATPLAAMGVFAVASSRRTQVGRKRTFGPSTIRRVA